MHHKAKKSTDHFQHLYGMLEQHKLDQADYIVAWWKTDLKIQGKGHGGGQAQVSYRT